MPASKKILVDLGKKKIKFEIVEHKKVFTAYDLAQTLGAKLEQIAKTLLVHVQFPAVEKKRDGYYVVVLPANYRLDLDKLKKALKAAKVSLAPEKAMKKLGVAPGALAPFGSRYELAVLLDKGLLKVKEAFMGAESFTESLRLKVKDYVKAEEPRIVSIGKNAGLKLQRALKKLAPKKKKKPTGKKKNRKSR